MVNLESYSKAPYNFIRLPKNIIYRYENFDELPAHDSFFSSDGKKLLSGTIKYSVETKTPLLIASGSEKSKTFFKNPKNEYVIPGSTMRGLFKTNASILSLSSVDDEIYDSRFLFRTFADNSSGLRDEYKRALGIETAVSESKKTYSLVKHVKAGFIYEKYKDNYIIIPAKTISDKSYYRINEDKLKRLKVNDVNINYLSSENYEPYCSPISFDLSINEKVVDVKNIGSTNKFRYNGYILCSGKMEGKTSHYIINEPDDKNEIMINIDDIRAYNEDLNRKKEKRGYYKLPSKTDLKNGKPIFYVEDKTNNRVYFGFTPYLRIFYKNSVKHGIPYKIGNGEKIDYCKAMFGFTNKNNSYKSRVSFEDLKIKGNYQVVNGETVVLGEPKATCFQHYLVQKSTDKNKLVSYNKDSFEIRGIKQYWIKDKLDPKSSGKFKVDAVINPINQGTLFEGEIHFNNLYEDELGLLVWAIELNKNSIQNIGMAKPYGYGQVKIKINELMVDNLKKKYEAFSFDYSDKKSPEEYIKMYKSYVEKTYGIRLDENDFIKELIDMKTNVIDSKNAEYIKLSDFKDRKVLPTVEDMINNGNVTYSGSDDTAGLSDEALKFSVKKLNERLRK